MTLSPCYDYHSRVWFTHFTVILINVDMFFSCRILEPINVRQPDHMEYDRPVVNTNVLLSTDRDYVNI